MREGADGDPMSLAVTLEAMPHEIHDTVGLKCFGNGVDGYLCHNVYRLNRTMILDELKRDFEAVRGRALVIRGYL